MNFLDNKSFCPMAWVHIASHTDGSARLCCISNRFIQDEKGEKYNLGESSIDTILNSQDYKNIRKDMLEGKLILGCESCYKAENYSKTSSRTQFIRKWLNNKSFKNKLNQSIENKDIDSTIEFFDLRFGNLCNLSCRYCFSEVSTTYNKEATEINEKFKDVIFPITSKEYNSWYDTETFNNSVYEQIPNLEKYYAAGGEPTLIDKNYEFMEYMVNTGHSQHIELQISTNLTNTKKDFYSLLPHFKKVTFLASLDGVGPIQEYLRYPSNWKQLDSNFRKVVALPNDNISITITPVLQKTNLGYITELFEYAEVFNREFKRNKVNVVPIILNQPDYYDFSYLPLDYKTECLAKIDDWVTNQCKYQDSSFRARLKTIREKCIENVDYTENLAQFFKFTDIVDSHRGHDLRTVNPNLAGLRDK
jgi:sulfatase maturation enzyme AslB (radical SAM superfamily)